MLVGRASRDHAMHPARFDSHLLAALLRTPATQSCFDSVTSLSPLLGVQSAALKCDFDLDAKFSLYASATGLVQGSTLAGIDHLLAASSRDCFWLGVRGYQEHDIVVLSRIFHLHPLTTEDILSPDEAREKCEVFDHYVFLCVNTLTNDQVFSPLFTESFLFVLMFPTCVLTLHQPPLVHIRNVLARFNRNSIVDLKLQSELSSRPPLSEPIVDLPLHSMNENLITSSGLQTPSAPSPAPSSTHDNAHVVSRGLKFAPDWIVYALLDDVMDSLRPVISAMEYDVDCIDDLAMIVNSNEQGDMLQRMRGASKKVTQLARLLHSKTDVIKTFSNRCSKYADPNLVMYLRDIQDHVITLRHTLQISLETLQNAHNLYLSHVNVELSQTSNESNKIMKTLSVLSVVFLPMSVITGLFGMNVPIPGQSQGDAEPKHWFFGILLGMITLGVISYLAAKRFNYM